MDVSEEAMSHWQAKRHAEAIKACLQRLSGPKSTLELLRECVASWEQEERKRIMGHEDDKKSIMAQLMDAKERSSKLRQQKEGKDAELTIERNRREDAENSLVNLRQRLHALDEVRQENVRLKQQLRTAEAARRSAAARPSPSREELVRHFAELECEPLRLCSDQCRAALKKKILLKWHPDKQPSAEHAGLATQVMQELQNRCEWSW